MPRLAVIYALPICFSRTARFLRVASGSIRGLGCSAVLLVEDFNLGGKGLLYFDRFVLRDTYWTMGHVWL